MCGSPDATNLEGRLEPGPAGGVRRVVAVTDLMAVARHVARSDEVRRTAAGFIGLQGHGVGPLRLAGAEVLPHQRGRRV